MTITFPHVSGPFDGYLRFTELEGVHTISKEDDFVTKTPNFKSWPVIICQRHNAQSRALRFSSKEARNKTYDKLMTDLHAKHSNVYLNSDDFTLPLIDDEQAYKLLRERGTTFDLRFETSKVFGKLEESDAFKGFTIPTLILDDARKVPVLKLRLAVETFTLTLLVPKAVLNLKVSRKQYFKYKCNAFNY